MLSKVSNLRGEHIRFAINGLIASGIHFFVLSLSIVLFEVSSAAMASVLASTFGIASSFFGNRHFVFSSGKSGTILSQLKRFLPLYLSMFVLHSSLLFTLTDLQEFDYRFSFLVATSVQAIVSYFCNKNLVFQG